MNKFISITVIIFSLLGCSDNPDRINDMANMDSSIEEINWKSRELELKEKELQLKEQELELLKHQSKSEPLLSEIYEDVRKSVYLIYTEGEKGIAQGSAFVISPDGLAISNYHVFENAANAIAFNDTNKEFLITEVIEYDEEYDFILFRIGPINRSIPYLKLATEIPSIGERCFAIGNPHGLAQTLSDGIISSYRADGTYIQTTAQITHGSSGGPLFNRKGEVIGITTMGINEADLNFALNILKLPIDQYLYHKVESKPATTFSEVEIRDFIRNYYSTIHENSYHNLGAFYADTLKRYFDSYNLPKILAVQNARSYKEKNGIEASSTQIRWNTLKAENACGVTRIQFIMDYKIVRKNKSKPAAFVLEIVMELNQEKKIQSIYENIISRI